MLYDSKARDVRKLKLLPRPPIVVIKSDVAVDYVQQMDETLPDVHRDTVSQPYKEKQMASLVTSGTSLIFKESDSDEKVRDTNGTDAKTVVHTTLTNKEAYLLNHAANKAALKVDSSALKTKEVCQEKTIPPVVLNTRPLKTAATAGIARQTKQETGSLKMLMKSALDLEDMDVDMEIHHGIKKRTNERHGRAQKRSREIVNKVSQKTLDTKGAGQNLTYGKKQCQTATYRADLVEPSPIITDVPPLPFTSTSPELRIKGKNKSKSKQYVNTKNELSLLAKETNSRDDRTCEYCKKMANICVLMHCHACRRVYHAQCFLHAFKPYVDEIMPIRGQIEHLQLKVSECRGNIFGCASCKAAFLDFYESGGYMWDCDCPTCSQPEKTFFYRQRKLVQMINAMKLEKQRKKEQKEQRKKGSSSACWKSPVSTSSLSNSI